MSAYLSVVIPIALNEDKWRALVAQLSKSIASCNSKVEILCVNECTTQDSSKEVNWIKIKKQATRADALNAGAKASSGDYLWFLHADSVIKTTTVNLLLKTIAKNPDSLLYFDLKFLRDGSSLMVINSLGVWLRSRLFKTPFGDQGLCIKKTHFDKLNGFPNYPTGEDHFFVCKARKMSMKITPIKDYIYTSARKYSKNGWLSTTLTHQYLWLKQSLLANKMHD